MKTEWIILCFAGLLLFLFLILFIIVLFQQNKRDRMMNKILEDQSRTKAQLLETEERLFKSLFDFQSSLSSSVRNDFYQFNESTMNHLIKIEDHMNRSMLQGMNYTSDAFSKVMEQIGRLDTAQSNLHDLSKQLLELQNILNDKKRRGMFGEMQLYALLENSLGPEGISYKKQAKLSNGMIADCVVFAPDPLKQIVIDSKFPMENYNRMIDMNCSEHERKYAKMEFKKDIVKHIKDISSKYLISSETADFAYMFIPSESVFSEIVSEFSDLIEKSYRNHIYPASPSTLMAYLTVIQAMVLEQRRNEKIHDIQHELMQLSNEFERFSIRWLQFEKDIEKTIKDAQSISITVNKIKTKFNQIEDVKFDQ